MTDHTPPTNQQLDAYETAARNAARIGSGIDPAAVLELAAEVRRQRAELATAQADTLGAVAVELESIDFHPSAKSTCRDLCRMLAGRFRRKALAVLDEVRAEASAPDTLPAWLYQRFMPHGDGWDRLDDGDRAYWEHQARAVRRAVARGGFKTAAGSAVAATGDEQ